MKASKVQKTIRKEALRDDYFIENGYWIPNLQESRKTKYNPEGGEKYVIYESTEKWRALVETCLRKINPKKEIILPDLVVEVINTGTQRNKRKNNFYVKLTQEEKDRRAEIRRLEANDKRLNANRNTK